MVALAISDALDRGYIVKKEHMSVNETLADIIAFYEEEDRKLGITPEDKQKWLAEAKETDTWKELFGED